MHEVSMKSDTQYQPLKEDGFPSHWWMKNCIKLNKAIGASSYKIPVYPDSAGSVQD